MSGNKIKVIERMAFGQDKLIAICNICGSYYLIGVSSQSIKILAQLDAEHFATEETPQKLSFKEILHTFKNSGKKIDL